MRLQVIQDSLFSRLGSGPFSGRGKRESRNRTILCHRSLVYEMLLMKLRPSHLKGSNFGTAGGSHRIALTPGIPLPDSVVLFIWLTVSTSLPEFSYALTWFLIVAALRSNDPFPPWGSEKSLLNATWYPWLVLSWPAG